MYNNSQPDSEGTNPWVFDKESLILSKAFWHLTVHFTVASFFRSLKIGSLGYETTNVVKSSQETQYLFLTLLRKKITDGFDFRWTKFYTSAANNKTQ